MSDHLELKTAKVYKVFLVEEGDDDRERVITGLTKNIEIKCDPQYDDDIMAVHRYQTSADYTVVLDMIPREDGTVFTMENFNEPPNYEEWEEAEAREMRIE
jgi:hypothetical protein